MIDFFESTTTKLLLAVASTVPAFVIITTLIIYQFDWPKEIFHEAKIFLLSLGESVCKVRFPLHISTALGMNWINHQLQ